MTREELNRLTAADVAALAAECINGATPPCVAACPFGLDVRSFVQKAEKGRDKATFKAYRDAVVFPVIVSALCPAPCECVCVRDDLGGAIDLRGIERSVVARMRNSRRESYVIPQKNQRVAIIGAGYAGLSAALCLSLKRYGVTVFEVSDAWGGALRSHPRFAEFDEELRASFEPLDTEFWFNTEVCDLAELAQFDAIYVTTGCDVPTLTAAESRGVSGGNVFLGGALVGAELMESIAQGRAIATQIEVFVQTGSGKERTAEDACDWVPELDGAAFKPRIQAALADGVFTVDEAQKEAARCLKCDCDKCMRGCEMLARYHKMPQKIANEAYTDIRANPPYSSRTITRQAYSCNSCGRCEDGCQKSINVGEILRLSRRTRVADATAPPALHDYWLREMDFSTGEAAFSSAGDGKGTCEYLFFPGCQLGAYNPAHVTHTFARLREALDVGIYLGCCGAPAYWAGDDERLQANSAQLRADWETMGRPKLIYACTTCTKMFAELLPEVEGISLYQVLAKIGDECVDCNSIVECKVSDEGAEASACEPFLSKRYDRVAIFDPCSVSNDEDTQNAVRAMVAGSGIEFEELPERGKCCGYGGLIQLANPALHDEITEKRVSASELPYIVYCSNCRATFAARGKGCCHILDILFGLESAPTPNIDARRRNSMEVKRVMSEKFAEKPFTASAKPWDEVRLKIDAETAERIDRKLISQAEIREAIYLAEREKRYFAKADGTRRCSQVKRALVYWITYKTLQYNEFEIVNAYYHRMKFGGGNENG